MATGSDETNDSTSFMKNTMITSTMVSGEASETDEEDEEEEPTQIIEKSSEADTTNDKSDVGNEECLENSELIAPDSQRDLQTASRAPDKTKRQKIVYKFDSPLHRKLRERNLVLRTDIVEGVSKLYRAANDRLTSSGFHLSRAQSAAQDIAHNTRLMCEDLNTLSENLDKILSPSLLPTIKMQS